MAIRLAPMVVRGDDSTSTDGSICGRAPLVWDGSVCGHVEVFCAGCVGDQRELVCEGVFRKLMLGNAEETPLLSASLVVFRLGEFAVMALTSSAQVRL